jgi:hypothetical protein
MRLHQTEMMQEWQDKQAKSEATRRQVENTQYEQNLRYSLARVLSNERRRRDAAIASEMYSRYNDWATI